MASNYRKSFNFKNGVQVDNDNFIVDPLGKVGIGTTVPTQFLDVYGNNDGAVQVQGKVEVTGLTTVTNLYAGVGTIRNLTGTGSSIGIGTFNQLKVGNSPVVNNLIGYAYTAWITDDGGVGLRTDSLVGIGSTTNSNYALLIGSVPTDEGVNGIGFTDGNIEATGVITATTFVGSLTGVAASATILETSRTFEIIGDLEGAAISFNGSDNVSIASTLSSSFSAETTGIITANTLSGILTASSGYIGDAEVKNLDQVTGGIATFVNIDGSYGNFDNLDVGVGTVKTLIADNSAQTTTTFTVRNTNATADTSEISIGKSDTSGNQSAKISYTSDGGKLDIRNYDIGDITVTLHDGTAAGVDTGSFKVNYKDSNLFEISYDGLVSIANTFDVDGKIIVGDGIEVSGGVVTVTSGTDSYTLDPSNPPVNAGDSLNIATGVSTIHHLKTARILVKEEGNALEVGFNTTFETALVEIAQNQLDVGYNGGISTFPYTINLNSTNVVSAGGSLGGKITADRIEAVGGESKIIIPFSIERLGTISLNSNIITGINTTDIRVGCAITSSNTSAFNVFGDADPLTTITNIGLDEITVSNNSLVAVTNETFTISRVGVGTTHFKGNIDNRSRATNLGITTISGDLILQGAVDPASNNPLGGEIAPSFYIDTEDPNRDSLAAKFIYISNQYGIGIGTTTLSPYHTPNYHIIQDGRNLLTKSNSTTTVSGKLLVRRASDQRVIEAGNGGTTNVGPISLIQNFNADGRQDPRAGSDGIDAWYDRDVDGETLISPDHGIPYFHPGKNIDIDTVTTSMIFDGSLSIVAFPPRKSPGYGANSGNDAYDQGSLASDSTGRTVDPNTLDTNSTRLTMVGINTYLPRCVVDFSGASPTINSYMLLPSLSSTDIATMAGMYQNASDAADDNNGVRNAKRLTPDGVPGGALLYNTTTDQIQVRDTASSFRTLGSPQVASGEVTGEVPHTSSEATTGLSASITLRSSTSKVMVHVTQPVFSEETIGQIILKRTIGAVTETLITTNYGAYEINNVEIRSCATASISYLDTPGGTGPVTYETFGIVVAGQTNFYSNAAYEGSSIVDRTSHITLMEIE